MFPEAPIALRMSSHLLLGVVRIYSKKVDYLHHDCNAILISVRRAFAFKEVNLPESAANPPPESVTLPEIANLDALNLDDDLIHTNGDNERYLMSPEDITLPDYIPVGRDFYVAITFDEDSLMDQSRQDVTQSDVRVSNQDGIIILSPMQRDDIAVSRDPIQNNQAEITNDGVNNDSSGSDVRPMEEDMIPPSLTVDTNTRIQDPRPSNQTGELNNENSPPDIEIMRAVVHDFPTNKFPVWPDLQNDPNAGSSGLLKM